MRGQGESGSPQEVHSVALPAADLHAAELQAVGVRLVVRGQVVVVEDTDTEHGGVNAGAQEEDGDEARHLVERGGITNTEVRAACCQSAASPRCTGSCSLAPPAG